ncbi:hypothetical protein [Hymenobacter sp. UYCo722]|uniref:hypothetical protein n=1 Tax=Hymenobacter sp. UYCo722 TaxID=3156335 RepID=UPI0033943C42
MELDDLRRQWQQPEPVSPPAVDAVQLRGMLARVPTNLVAKLRRNTWVETVFTALVGVGALVYLVSGPELVIFRLYGVVFVLLALLLLFHYYRQLKLLGRMGRAETHVRKHLGALCAGLRRQIQFYYRLTLATLPLTTLLNLGFVVGQELVRAARFRWGLVGLEAGCVLLLVLPLQWAAARGTRWYLQRLYGQHLDRLEASLRELAEPEPATTD